MRTREIKIRIPDDDLIEKKFRYDVSNLEWVSRLDNRKWNYKKAAKEKGYHIDINVGCGDTKNG